MEKIEVKYFFDDKKERKILVDDDKDNLEILKDVFGRIFLPKLSSLRKVIVKDKEYPLDLTRKYDKEIYFRLYIFIMTQRECFQALENYDSAKYSYLEAEKQYLASIMKSEDL